MKNFKTALFIVLLAIAGRANDFNALQIEKAAGRFIRYSGFFNTAERYTIDRITAQRTEKSEFWLVRLRPAGFIICSPDSQLKAVIAYSAASRFSGHRETLEWLYNDVRNRRRAIQQNQAQRQRNRELWRVLLGDEAVNISIIRNGAMEQRQTALYKTAGDSIYYFPAPVWGQGSVNYQRTFNYYTPNHWSAGCVATAMAEVLAYYRWPLVGSSSHCYYEDDAGQLCADYENTWYDWPNTLEKYKDVPATDEQRKAAGLLTFHTAVSVEMDFSASGSTAETADAPNALHKYFRYSGHYKSVNAAGFWDEMRHNMEDARPAILSIKRSDGLGHAVVVDGYAEANGMYHLDMGWNGDDNGWYDISGSWNAGGYTIVVGSTKGIVPNPMINESVQMIDDATYILSWSVSPKQRAQYYELQQAAAAGGPWSTLSAAISDTFFQVTLPEARNYYYRVRARRDDIWWDWSTVQKISLGGARYLTFNVNMNAQTLHAGDSVVVRGNIPPLLGSQNSPAFSDADSDGIYSLTLPFEFDYVGQELSYRFAIARAAGGTDMESFNRTYMIGWDEYQNLDTVFFDDYTAVEGEQEAPEKLVLLKSYPNPFGEKVAGKGHTRTTIQYRLGLQNTAQVDVTVAIYNILGEKISTLVQRRQAAGNYRLQFDGQRLPAGVYFIRLQAGGQTVTHKMLLLR